jgi:peptidoglycan/LPS O-acetylase OafA/YrhL
LDVIRGIAVLLVMLHHILLPAAQICTNEFMRLVSAVLAFIKVGGWVGVDMFFVLSGFLVSGLLFKDYKLTQKVHGWNFLIRRGFKIYPTLYVFLLVTFIVDMVLHHFGLSINEVAGSKYSWIKREYLTFASDALFLDNYLGGRWQQTWSLDIEEAFYLILTLFFILLLKFKKFNFKSIFVFYIFLLVFGIAARAYSYLHHPMDDINAHFEKTHFRLDSMLMGVMLSYLFHFHKEKLDFFQNNKLLLATLSIVYLLSNFIFPRENNAWVSVVSLAINPFCFATLIILAIHSTKKLFNSATLSFIGRISYALYLWHGLALDFLVTYFPFNKSILNYTIYLVSYFVLSIVLAKVFTQIIEVPFLKLRDNFFPPKTVAPLIST